MIVEEESYPDIIFYTPQYQYNIKALFYVFGVFAFVDILRGQIPEVKLIQLVPGLYLLYLFLAFLFLVALSNSIYRFTIFHDLPLRIGIRSKLKMTRKTNLKWILFFFFLILLIILNTVIPISLDSFRTYEKKTVEGAWSYGQVLFLENFLAFVLILLSQLPILFLSDYYNEEQIIAVPKMWRSVSFTVLIGSGFLTPTIDIWTQLSFATSVLFLYYLSIDLSAKRSLLKLNSFNLLNN